MADAGAEVRLDGGVLKLYAPGPFPADLRAELSAAKPQLLKHPARWNAGEAIRPETAADDLVSRLGVDGQCPEIQEPAAWAVREHLRKNLAGVAAAAADVGAAARKLAGAKPAG